MIAQLVDDSAGGEEATISPLPTNQPRIKNPLISPEKESIAMHMKRHLSREEIQELKQK